MEILKQRYPDLGFLISFFPHNKVVLPKDDQPLVDWVAQENLNELEVIYLVGLIGYKLPQVLIDWLVEKKERVLIFIEDELGAFVSFTQEEYFLNSQIHFHYAQEDPIEYLAKEFPTVKLAIFEGKPFDAEKLRRRSHTYSALYSDVLYSHKIVENVFANMSRLKGTFDARGTFKQVPAIICGAGPSLEKTLPILEQMKNQALIFAGGSAITAMTKKGVQPHFAMALDPNDDEFERLKQAHYFEGPFLFAPRLHRDVFSTANGPFGYMKTDTGGLIENWLEDELKLQGDPVGPDLGDEAFSVTTLAISYAYALGCNPIILVGVDLAYTDGKRYPEGIEAKKEKEKRIKRQDIHGNPIETQLAWVMESDCIAKFAKTHPEITFLNATEGGIGFEGIENTKLAKALEDAPVRDLQGEIHQWIQFHPLLAKTELLPKLLTQLETSLGQCEELVAAISIELEKKVETGKLILMESDLREELAYKCLLEGIDLALNHLLVRYYPNLNTEEGKWERAVAKYLELGEQIRRFRLQKVCV